MKITGNNCDTIANSQKKEIEHLNAKISSYEVAIRIFSKNASNSGIIEGTRILLAEALLERAQFNNISSRINRSA